jgi:DNA topoisomerase-1
VLAATALRELQKADSQAQAKKNVLKAIEAVAGLLGNTRAVCRKSYIHPAIIDSYMDGSMLQTLSRRANGAMKKVGAKLRPEEAAVLALLQRRLAKDARSHAA